MIIAAFSEPSADFPAVHLRLYSIFPGEYRCDLHAWHGARRLYFGPVYGLRLAVPSVFGKLHKGVLGRLPPKQPGFSNVVGLRINDNMVNWVLRFCGVVRLAAEGGTGVLGRKVGPDVGMRMIDDLDRSWAAHAFEEETQVFPP